MKAFDWDECTCCGGTVTDDDACGDCGCTPEPVSVSDGLDDFLSELEAGA